MICKNCGKENPDDVYVCEKCNKPLDIIIENKERINMKEKLKNSIKNPRFFKFDIFVIPVITVILLFAFCFFTNGMIEKNIDKKTESYGNSKIETEYFELVFDGKEYTGTDEGVYSETDVYITNTENKIPDDFELIGKCNPQKAFTTKDNDKKMCLILNIENELYEIKIEDVSQLFNRFSDSNVYLYGNSSRVRIGDYWYLTDVCFLLEAASK